MANHCIESTHSPESLLSTPPTLEHGITQTTLRAVTCETPRPPSVARGQHACSAVCNVRSASLSTHARCACLWLILCVSSLQREHAHSSLAHTHTHSVSIRVNLVRTAHARETGDLYNSTCLHASVLLQSLSGTKLHTAVDKIPPGVHQRRRRRHD